MRVLRVCFHWRPFWILQPAKSVFRGLEPRNLWIVFWPLTKLSTWVYHTRKELYFFENKHCSLYRCVKSCFHLAAILNFAVSWCEAWNPLLGMGVFWRSDRFPSRYKRLRRFLVSYLTPVDRWIQNEHEYSGQIFPNVPDLRYSSLLPSPDHLCQPEAHRFWKQDSFLSVVMHLNNSCIITSSPGFFYGKSPGVERSGSRGNVATFMLGALWVSRAVTVNSVVAYFRIGEYLWGRWIGERTGGFWKYFCPGFGIKGRF